MVTTVKKKKMSHLLGASSLGVSVLWKHSVTLGSGRHVYLVRLEDVVHEPPFVVHLLDPLELLEVLRVTILFQLSQLLL